MIDRVAFVAFSVLAVAIAVAMTIGCHRDEDWTGSAAVTNAELLQHVKRPMTVNVIDAAGALSLLQGAISAYRTQHPDRVARFSFTKAPAPELPGKLRAMQAAGRSDIDLVLGGTDILAAGIDQQLWTRILPDHEDVFPGVLARYQPQALKMQELAQGQALAVVYMPGGPLLELNPERVTAAPTTPAALLAWCRAHPNRFIYPRPANSGPGRTFLMGLPYLLGDRDPLNPDTGWDKTWAYLKELDSCIEYYPTGTSATMKELGEGSRDLTVTVTGWDINARAIGIVPPQFRVGAFDNMTWVNDAQYLMVPRSVPALKRAVVLDLMAFLLKPEQQALTYDKGYFYPGPAMQGVPLSSASPESREVLKQFGRPDYDAWIAEHPHARPVEPKRLVEAFRRWDREIGSRKSR